LEETTKDQKKHEKEEGEKKKKDKRVNSIMETSDREEKTQTAGC
jgi:hypothetical protein